MTDDLKIRFLVVDDEKSIRSLCMRIAGALGFSCDEAPTAEAALDRIDTQPPDVILVDMRMAQMSGMEFLEQVKKRLPRTEVTIMTGYGTIESAVQAMRLGAYDFIVKPFVPDQLKLTLKRMAEKVRLVSENEFLRDRFDTENAIEHGIVGSHSRIQDVLRMVSRLKDTRTPVLITGESGTGKELIARAIHFRGPLAKKPFIAVDCGALVPTLIESELFGHDKGAFTGAIRAKEGLFQAADGGTIFLDEIGELPLDLQAKLLRVLQEREIRPVGTNHPVKVDVRVIAATNRDLEAAYQQGNFRKDLFFRLNVVAVHLPALRERRSDIPLLSQFFLDRYAPERPVSVSPEAMGRMLAYDWPGNVRELENCIERAIALGDDDVIDVEDLPPTMYTPADPETDHETAPTAAISDFDGPTSHDLEEIERATIQKVFDEVNGDKVLAGRLLGISRATLYRKIKRYEIQLSQKSRAAAVGQA